jgi:hypothetical protein
MINSGGDGIRFSVRKCDNAKMPERFPLPVRVKPLEAALSKQQAAGISSASLEQVTLKTDSLPGLARTAKLEVREQTEVADHPILAMPNVGFANGKARLILVVG